MKLGESGWLSGFLSGLPPLRAGVQFWLRLACGLSFSRSQPDSRVFLRVLRFSSLAKIDSQLINIWLWCCAPTSNMDCIAAARGAFVCFQSDVVSRALQFSPRLQVRVISTSNIYIFTSNIYKFARNTEAPLSGESSRRELTP